MEVLLILIFAVHLLLNQRPVSSFRSSAETKQKFTSDKNDCFLQTNDGVCLNRHSYQGIAAKHVKVWIGILQITEIDDFHDTVEISAWIQMFWTNNFLKSQRDFTWMFVQPGWQTKIWYPEMEIDRLIDLKLFKIESKPTSKNLYGFIHLRDELSF